MDIRKHNRAAWDQEVKRGNKWTIPVSPKVIANARKGKWHIVLTPLKPVPKDWLPRLEGSDVLCLASGGGQQGPVLAAAGAKVTVLDNSPMQLQQDQLVAKRESLTIRTIEGDMSDLSMLGDECFNLIVHPVSNNFVPDVRAVWTEAFRVLQRGGVLLSGFTNPAIYLFDYELADSTGVLKVKYSLPYSDEIDLAERERTMRIEDGSPLEFSHTLDDLIGGQLDAGFVITGFYEDRQNAEESEPLVAYMPTCIATRAVKL
ncbi:hypothetical protein ES703_56236 [subsurface metagenome]